MAQDTPLLPSTVLVRSSEQVSSELDGKVVLLSIANGEYYHMNAVGSRVWELLAEPRSVEAVIGILLAEFEVERAVCERDVLPFLSRLMSAGLLRVPMADDARGGS